VRLTHKLLREALVVLIEEHCFDALTVEAIAERAMVSRAAFYRHYQDKYDLVKQIFEEAIQTKMQDIDLGWSLADLDHPLLNSFNERQEAPVCATLSKVSFASSIHKGLPSVLVLSLPTVSL
jgi:AcrR family transcriptional regulator